jgi:Predicted Fe-S oxidoreductases
MSLAEFNVVFNKIKSNLLAVGFWNLGEPLLNGSLFEMVRVAAREDIFSIVLTNGTLLDQRKSQEVIASGLDYLGISMDGASASSYNKYRLGGDFKTVVGNIKFLIEEKKRRRSLTPFVEIIFLVMKDNEREIEAMIKLAGDLGVNKLSLKKVSLGFADEFIEPAEFLPAERRYIHSIHAGSISRLKKHCISPWLQVAVNADGNVVSCCGDYYSVSMGNLFTEGFPEIWNGARSRNSARH